MLSHGSPLCFEREPDLARIEDIAGRTWEIVEYIVHGLGVEKWPGRVDARAAFHASCHSRGSRTTEAGIRLLSSIAGLELSHPAEAEQCCGFGGSFAVTFPHISTSMGRLKIETLCASNPDFVVSADMSCLMHQQGLAEKQGRPLAVRHLIQVLRDALRNGGLIAES
jgi:L-lactate dehydrogenase complex protein LldE